MAKNLSLSKYFLIFFIALIFLCFDLRMGSFNFLPDALGYLLFALTMGAFAQFPAMKKARLLAFLLIPLSALDFYQLGGDSLLFSLIDLGALLISTALGLLFIRLLLSGIAACLGRMSAPDDLKRFCSGCWLPILFSQVLYLALYTLCVFLPDLAIFAAIAGVIRLVMQVLLLTLLFRTYRLAKEAEA